jgi:hypothetical protein
VEEDQEKSQDKMLRCRDRIAIFGLISTIKITKVAKEGLGLASNYKRPPFPSCINPNSCYTYPYDTRHSQHMLQIF